MKYKAVIEIPRGSDRRIHMKYDGSGFEDFGPIKEKIPVNEGVMPVAYGYIANAINKNEGDNVDVIIFSQKNLKTGDKIDVEIIGLLNRDDGDHKVVAVDDSVTYGDFAEVPIQDRTLMLEYFGYGHQITIENKDRGLDYLLEASV